MRTLSLRMIKNGQSGVIAAVKASDELDRRIREMRLVPGTTITVSGRAPLHDPVAVRVMGGTLMPRNNEANSIIVDI